MLHAGGEQEPQLGDIDLNVPLLDDDDNDDEYDDDDDVNDDVNADFDLNLPPEDTDNEDGGET